MSTSNLEFRKIPSLKFLYEVNSNGTVIRNVKSKRHLKCFIERRQYKDGTEGTPYWTTQTTINKKHIKIRLHQVVAECWLGPRPEGCQVDHIDQNSLNNDYRNLRYVGKSEQMLNRNYKAFEQQLFNNLGQQPKRVTLIDKTGVRYPFESHRKAARFLAERYPQQTMKHFNDKLYHRRKHIFDFDVIYLNAETGHGNQDTGKEQST